MEKTPRQTLPPVLCAGMHSVDLLLINSDIPKTPESVVFFEKYIHVPGGSVYNTAKGFVLLGIPVKVLTKVGNDENGRRFIKELESLGIDTCDVRMDDSKSTCLSVLPVYYNGGRGAFSHLGTNTTIQVDDLLDDKLRLALQKKKTMESNESSIPPYWVYHYGYPHMVTQVQGEILAQHFQSIRSLGITIALDMNGANTNDEGIVHSALESVGIFHVNIEEAIALSGKHPQHLERNSTNKPLEDRVNFQQVKDIADYFHDLGVALVAITLGPRGAFLSTHPNVEILKKNIPCFPYLPKGTQVFRPNFQTKGTINGVGAGDTFTAGLLAMLIYQKQIQSSSLNLELLTDVGLAAAMQRIDSGTQPKTLVELIQQLDKMPRASSVQPL
ncbi:hypothetical protein GpartN1_g3704.t1 [Galdieria partita]|uniref:Carbohydrate kinase PfkB domain-containing protein n=1 Tax=Galdieria partita TaxID=83374 RepID=A0A9C7PWA1_9RHOD|nr:hypothetical protein GpartN1_g3704.t1 [Galdieria partita]